MSKWKECKLQDITVFIKDGSHGTHKDASNGIPLLSAKDINDGQINIPDDCRKISIEDYSQIHSNYSIENNDLLITIVGTIGRVAIVKELKQKITFQRSVGIIRLNRHLVSSTYIFHYFQSDQFQRALKKSMNASAQGGVYLGEIAKLNIHFPISLAEQQRIASILSTCDAVIEKTQEAIAKFKAIKQGVLHDLFTRGIDINTGKLRPHHEGAPDLYKESKLGWIPKEWREEEFQDVCPFITDGSHFSPKPVEEGEIIVNVKDMGEYGIKYATCTRISRQEFDFLKKQNCSPQKGDVLLSKDGTIGRVILFNDDRQVVLLSSIAILRPFSWLLSAFLYFYIKSAYFDVQLQIKTSGSALKRIVLKDINTLIACFPKELDEQRIITDRLVSIEQQIESEQAYLQKMQQIKKGLMEDLLSGKVSVDHLIKEMH